MRRIGINLRIAFRSLWNFKVRSLLAVLGVFLGTFSLIVVSNLSDSLAQKTEQEVAALGKNLLIVRSGVVRRVGISTQLLSTSTNLTADDATALLEGSGFISDVSPSSNKSFPVRHGNTMLSSVLIVGVMPNYTNIRNFLVKEGTFINDEDNNNLNKVAVIGSRIAEKLFGGESPLGKHILIYRVPCRIIGVMEEKGVDLSGVDQDSQIFIPLNTFLRRFVNKSFISNISVQVIDGELISRAKGDIEQILRKRHRIRSDQKDDFTVIDLKDVTALKTQAMNTISVLGRISSSISFLIGGLGILSIMILIVNERRVEIGIRRAVGSRKRDILLQFLMEAAFISFSGGTAGLFLSFLATLLIFWFAGLPFVLSPQGYAISFFASLGVGILAGIYPAKTATAIQPVQIIRS